MNNIKVGKKYQFKSGLGLNNNSDGKEFIVTRIDVDLGLVYLKMINDYSGVSEEDLSNIIEYNVELGCWDYFVVPINKWQGSSLKFNFI